MKKLRRYIRQILLFEGMGMRTIADLPDGINIEIKEMHWGTEIYYSSVSEPGSTDIYPYGRITVEETYGTEGECDGAWKVSRADSDSGWGPLLYDVAIEWATINGEGLIADRSDVSEEAEAVWRHYMNNRISPNDVQMKQLSDQECDQDVAMEFEGPNGWMDSPLSKKYTKAPTTIDALKAAGKLVMR